jgi:Family of unknown function (DUF6399)
MNLKEFSLFDPTIESGTVLKALESAIPASAIEQAIKETKALEERTRALPSHLTQNYEQATKAAHERFLADDYTKNSTSSEQQKWIDWSIWMCTKFQQTSSAVEGRNGYLSGLHHSGRGFTEQTLKVLTIIHNFEIKRDDGTTAAQRLFEKPFPDLFEWIVPRMGELPRSRRTFKTTKSKKPTPSGVPL